MKTRTNQPIYKDDGTLLQDEDLGGGTEVVANPELAGTEDALTGLQVGNTKYAVGGGTKFFRHYIRFGESRMISRFSTTEGVLSMDITSGSGDVDLYIISTKNTKYTNMNEIMSDIDSGAIIKVYNSSISPFVFAGKSSANILQTYSITVESSSTSIVRHSINSFGYYRSDDILPI